MSMEALEMVVKHATTLVCCRLAKSGEDMQWCSWNVTHYTVGGGGISKAINDKVASLDEAKTTDSLWTRSAVATQLQAGPYTHIYVYKYILI